MLDNLRFTRPYDLLLALVLTALLFGCAGEGADEAPTEDPIEFLGAFGGKADGAVIRIVDLTLQPGAVKWYRIKATGFRATLSQTSSALARLSAKHYEYEFEGEAGLEPTLEAQADLTVRNWTLRVHNEGSETLVAQLAVNELTQEPAPGPGDGPTEPGAIELGILSDIDKTALPEHDKDLPLPAPYAGVAALYTELETGSGGQAGDMFWVTARTAEGAAGLDVWMEEHGLPAGPIGTGVSGIPWVAQPEKVSDISVVFDARPEQSFVLFGDSSHRDPEVYAEIRDKYPGRVLAIFIHKVNNPNPSRVEGMFLIENYAQATAALFGLGVITEERAVELIDVCRTQGVELTDEEAASLIEENRPE